MKLRILFTMVLIAVLYAIVDLPGHAQQVKQNEANKKRTLGVLLFPGFEVLDAYGPIQFWGNLPKYVQVVTVAGQRG